MNTYIIRYNNSDSKDWGSFVVEAKSFKEAKSKIFAFDELNVTSVKCVSNKNLKPIKFK